MASIEEIRAKLLKQEENKGGGNKFTGGDNAVYPFWNIDFDSSCTLRFLPDGDDANDFFWVERLVIKLPFNGIVGQTDKPVTVQVPCVEMYGRQCPIIQEIRPWWKDKELENMARTYYKKKSYLFQGFVTQNPLAEEGEGTSRDSIRRFVINSSIFDIIKQSLMDPDMDELPTDYNLGRDFRINKTKQGEWASYKTSSWSMKTRSLDEGELNAVNTQGLYTLRDFLPKEPTDEELDIIKLMFEASVNEEAYDPAKWGQYYRPQGVQLEGVEAKTTVEVKSPTPVETSTVTAEPVVEATETVTAPAATTSEPAEEKVDALAKLRARAESNEAPAETAPASGNVDANDILRVIRERASKQS